ncbi:MAG: TlpA family protein disulfide reductase [bacterium]
MKYRLLFFFLFSLFAAHSSICEAQKSSLKCTFRALPQGSRLVVSEPQGGKLVPTDTLALDAKGTVSLERALADPAMLVLTLTQPQSPMLHVLLLPKEKVTMEVEYLPAANLLDINLVKGSENMALYKSYTNMASELMKNGQGDQMADRMEALLDAHPGVLMSAFLVTFFEKSFEQHAGLYRKIRDALIDKWPENDFVRHIDGRLRSTMIGFEAPDIALADPDGNIRHLSDLRGKVVLIDFWASWCRPCRMENPNVVRLYKAYHDKGFEIFSVSLDNSRDAWLKAIATDHLEWPNHVSDLRGWGSAGGRLYGVQSIPATVLVSRDGIVLARNLRGQELENKLKEIFAQ